MLEPMCFRNFERELRSTRIDDFDYWIEYLKWMEQYFPSGSGKNFRIALERCLKHFGTKATSFNRINDPQWLYVWQKYVRLHLIFNYQNYIFFFSGGL